MRRPVLVSRHPLYSLDNIVVTLRHQDSVLILNGNTQELVWFWGQGEISGPHDAKILDNGNMLIFDNGLENRASRVIELNPITREIVWEFDGKGVREFFTAGRGASQRLPNGNTLISNSNSGEAFEVTRDGEVVWEFWNPYINTEGHRAILVRMIRYDSKVIRSILRQKRNERTAKDAD